MDGRLWMDDSATSEDYETPAKPTPDQCLTHLKLLEAFHQLREDVATTDGLYGIHDNFVDAILPAEESRTERAQLLLKFREKRWAIYVTQAAWRYQKWWKRIELTDYSMPTQSNLLSVYQNFGKDQIRAPYRVDDLPPLGQTVQTVEASKSLTVLADVLMVWHAHLLNPRDFLEDCIRYDQIRFWNTGLPLAAIDSCINNEDFEYRTGDKARLHFFATTSLPWNSLDDQQQLMLWCPNCARPMHVPWTTLTTEDSWKASASLGLGEGGTGFADQYFEYSCGVCHVTINHDVLRAQKFRFDCTLLMDKDLPMPGTILDSKGKPEPPEFGNAIETHAPLFPNRLIKAGLSRSLLAALDPSQYLRWSKGSVNDIRQALEYGLKDSSILERARGGIFPPSREEKLAVRKMMSRYWNNSSIFALDLVGAVIRQGTFIEKMHAIDWLHSPAVQSTMKRLLHKYDRYFAILSQYPGQTAVPTLDVDLAWHTHQLSPSTYYRHSVHKTDCFIDHDDKIPSPKLSTAFEWTSKIYQKMFQEPYSECTCWYCEAVRESHTSYASRHIFQRSMHKDIDSQLCALPNGKVSPHISAHNSISPIDHDSNILTTTKNARLNRMYEKARKRAEKKGRKVPDRSDASTAGYTYTYGVPIVVPYYIPYMPDPCVTGGMVPVGKVSRPERVRKEHVEEGHGEEDVGRMEETEEVMDGMEEVEAVVDAVVVVEAVAEAVVEAVE
ncbi:MAG: hypothetical protein Q9181_005384, partial [Wetmoreana brouardii]